MWLSGTQAGLSAAAAGAIRCLAGAAGIMIPLLHPPRNNSLVNRQIRSRNHGNHMQQSVRLHQGSAQSYLHQSAAIHARRYYLSVYQEGTLSIL